MTLAEFLSFAPRGALSELSRRCGIHHSVLIRYRDGDYVPRVDDALRIAEATGGAVPVESWARPPAPASAPPTPADPETGEAA